MAQHEQTGSIHPALLVSSFLQTLYCMDALYFEEAILSTLDIVYDEFGWMLAFGNITYVEFLYPISSWYLVRHAPDWPLIAWAGVLALGLFSMYAFRASNAERDLFKKRQLKNPRSITMVCFAGFCLFWD